MVTPPPPLHPTLVLRSEMIAPPCPRSPRIPASPGVSLGVGVLDSELGCVLGTPPQVGADLL